MQYHVVFGIIMYHAASWNVHIMLTPPQLPPGVHTAHASWYMSWSQSRATNQRTKGYGPQSLASSTTNQPISGGIPLTHKSKASQKKVRGFQVWDVS
jgi:hypothetical protein